MPEFRLDSISELLAEIPEGHWVALDPDETSVIASGESFEEVFILAPGAIITRKFSGVIILQAA